MAEERNERFRMFYHGNVHDPAIKPGYMRRIYSRSSSGLVVSLDVVLASLSMLAAIFGG